MKEKFNLRGGRGDCGPFPLSPKHIFPAQSSLISDLSNITGKKGSKWIVPMEKELRNEGFKTRIRDGGEASRIAALGLHVNPALGKIRFKLGLSI
jgi:hypothetical protein